MGHTSWILAYCRYPWEIALNVETPSPGHPSQTLSRRCLSTIALCLALLCSVFCLTSSVIVYHCSTIFFAIKLAPCSPGNLIKFEACLGALVYTIVNGAFHMVQWTTLLCTNSACANTKSHCLGLSAQILWIRLPRVLLPTSICHLSVDVRCYCNSKKNQTSSTRSFKSAPETCYPNSKWLS